jgi:hypothetical protein
VTQNNFAGSPETVDYSASDRFPAASLQLFCSLSMLAVSGVSLAMAGWLFLDFLGSLAAQLQSLDTMQLLHALTGA